MEDDFEAKVIEALKQCYDPELPIDIYNLGLIYKIDIGPDKTVNITMTLTSPFCPISDYFFEDIKEKVKRAGAKDVNVDLTFDPPWNKSMMSEEAKEKLDL